MPLPKKWDPNMFKLDSDVDFEQRLDYALERSTKVGAGSSRVAMVIPFNGRDTIVKIAKNEKGLAQNAAEVDILQNPDVTKLKITIPLIDFDSKNSQPTWIQTELATAIHSDYQLEQIFKANTLYSLMGMAHAIAGGDQEDVHLRLSRLKREGTPKENISTFLKSAKVLAKLSHYTLLDDLDRAANWGMFKGRPVAIDVGFTPEVRSNHYT